MSAEQPTNRLAYLPIPFFAMVMGLAGLSLAWSKARHVNGWQFDLGLAFGGLAGLAFVLLALGYTLKLLRYREMVLQELAHPVRLNFFPTLSISLLLLSAVCLPVLPRFAEVLWIIGTSLHLLLTLYVVNSWMQRETFQIQHMNPAWFIPAVGNVIVPIAGMQLGFERYIVVFL